MRTRSGIQSSLRHGLRLGKPHLSDTQIVGRQYVDADAIAFHALACLGHTAEPLADQPADSGRFDVLFAMEGSYQIGQAVQIEAAGDDEAAFAILLYVTF